MTRFISQTSVYTCESAVSLPAELCDRQLLGSRVRRSKSFCCWHGSVTDQPAWWLSKVLFIHVPRIMCASISIIAFATDQLSWGWCLGFLHNQGELCCCVNSALLQDLFVLKNALAQEKTLRSDSATIDNPDRQYKAPKTLYKAPKDYTKTPQYKTKPKSIRQRTNIFNKRSNTYQFNI